MHQDGDVNKQESATQNNHNQKRVQEKAAHIRMDSFGTAMDEKHQREIAHENNSDQRRRSFSPNRQPGDKSYEENKRNSRKVRRNRKRREGGPSSKEAGVRGRNDSTSDADPNWRRPVVKETPLDADVRDGDIKRVAPTIINKETSSSVDVQKSDKSQVTNGQDSKVAGNEKIKNSELIVTIDASSEGQRTVSEKQPTTNFAQHEGLPQRQRDKRRNRNKSWYEKVEEDNNTQIRNGHVDYRRGNRRVSSAKERDSQGKENTPRSKLVSADASAGGKNQINGHNSENSADLELEESIKKPEVKAVTVDGAKSIKGPPRSTEKQITTCNGHDQISVISEQNRKSDKESAVKREEKSLNAVKDVNGNY